MKKVIIAWVKSHNWLYTLYYRIGNFFLSVLRLFVKPDNKLILFISYGGKQYGDSPRIIYEAMRCDARFTGYTFVWAFHSPDSFSIDGARVIRVDTLRYFITALKARCWITNSGVERGLRFKNARTFYLYTLHGSALKSGGVDTTSNAHMPTFNGSRLDVILAQSEYDVDTYSRIFSISREKFLKSGFPRNDTLSNCTLQEQNAMKQKLGIAGKKVILYAPTFREYERDTTGRCVLRPPVHFERWHECLGEDYVVLFRAHYEVAKSYGIETNGFVLDVSDYPVLEELMKAADMLISDYSSIFFDFSIMHKPMLHFSYDYDTYKEKRGMYLDMRMYLDGSASEEELLQKICHLDIEAQKQKADAFCHQFVQYHGNATAQVVDCIAARLSAGNDHS